MKQMTVYALLACSASLCACGGGANDSGTTDVKTLATTSVVTGQTTNAASDASQASSASAPVEIAPNVTTGPQLQGQRGFPEDRAGYKPSDNVPQASAATAPTAVASSSITQATS